MINKEVNIDSIMTFIAWLRANDILFLKDYGSIDTDTDVKKGSLIIEVNTQDLKEVLTDFQDEGFLPEELKVEHVIKEINFRTDEINPSFSNYVATVPKETWNKKPISTKKWEKKDEEAKGDWGDV
jgi:hypothetical protein